MGSCIGRGPFCLGWDPAGCFEYNDGPHCEPLDPLPMEIMISDLLVHRKMQHYLYGSVLHSTVSSSTLGFLLFFVGGLRHTYMYMSHDNSKFIATVPSGGSVLVSPMHPEVHMTPNHIMGIDSTMHSGELPSTLPSTQS